jgi:hypothetical protein
MAKKNRSEEPEQTGGFRISKTKVGKPTLVTVTFQLPELQEAHLASVAQENDTTRAELCKQAVAHCLESMGVPFPDAGDVNDELREKLAARREQRAARAERLRSGQGDESEED